jgi:hypothetical protein
MTNVENVEANCRECLLRTHGEMKDGSLSFYPRAQVTISTFQGDTKAAARVESLRPRLSRLPKKAHRARRRDLVQDREVVISRTRFVWIVRKR